MSDKIDVVIEKLDSIEKRLDSLESKTNSIAQYVPFVGKLESFFKYFNPLQFLTLERSRTFLGLKDLKSQD